MKVKDFFILMVKLFGLYSLILSVITFLPQLISILRFGFDSIEVGLLSIGAFLTTFFITYLFIRKANTIVSFLKIEKGFSSDEISFADFKEDTIIKVAFIILGGYLFINNLPYFIRQMLQVITVDPMSGYYENSGVSGEWLFSLLNVFIGLALVFYYQPIQEFIFRKKKNQT